MSIKYKMARISWNEMNWLLLIEYKSIELKRAVLTKEPAEFCSNRMELYMNKFMFGLKRVNSTKRATVCESIHLRVCKYFVELKSFILYRYPPPEYVFTWPVYDWLFIWDDCVNINESEIEFDEIDMFVLKEFHFKSNELSSWLFIE